MKETRQKSGSQKRAGNHFPAPSKTRSASKTRRQGNLSKPIGLPIEERLQFETLLADISSAFVNLPSGDVDAEIRSCLQRIVELQEIDRCTLAQFSQDREHLFVTHSWAVSGVNPFPMVDVKKIFPWVFKMLGRGETYKFSGLEDIPDDAVFEKAYMKDKGEASGLIIPLKAGKKILGAIFLETLKSGITWQDQLVSRLEMLGEVFANALLHRRAEEELLASEKRYRSLVEDRPGFIVRWHPEGSHVFANQNYCRCFDKPLESINRWSFIDLIYPEDRPAVQSQISKLTPDNSMHSGERRVLLPDGTIGWQYWTDRAIFDDKGKLAEIESTGYDITELKTSEKAIRNIAEEITGLVGERFFQSLMIYLADVLEAEHALIGKFSEDRIDKLDLIAAFSHGQFMDSMACETSGSPLERIINYGFDISLQGLEHDFPGSSFLSQWDIHSIAGTLLYNSNRKPIGVLAVMDGKTFKNEKLTKNILSLFAFRAAAELEREQASEALRQSEQLFRMLAENARDMIFRATLPDGRYEYTSPASKEITGYSPEEIAGFHSFVDFVRAIIHPTFKAELDEIWDKFRAGKIRPYYEYKIIHKSGEERWVHQRSVLLYNKEGRPVAIEGIVTDITERKALENKILDMQKMQAVGTLAGGIAHDFNNILGVIIGNAEMMEMFDLPAKSPVRSRLEKIIDSGYRAKHLISRILTFASMGEHEKKIFPLKPIIKDALKFLRSSLPATIDIQMNIDNPDMMISGDPVQIQRVLVNLGTNAGHAMEGKKGKLTFALTRINHTDIKGRAQSELKPGGYALLKVEDTGKGMEPSVMKRIFEPYFTTKAYGEGVGLGLAVVHGIVANHDGFITVDSKVGKGSIFKVYFPVSGDFPEDRTKVKSKEPEKGKEKILFVDDEIFIVDVYREILEKYGYTVIGESNPQQALEIFRSSPDDFNLVITDMNMPQMTGDELIREIFKIRKDIPIIICTGYNDWLDTSVNRELGACDLLKKPVGAKQLAQKVRTVLDKTG